MNDFYSNMDRLSAPQLLLQGWRLLKDAKLQYFIALPVAIGCLLFIGLFLLLQSPLHSLIDGFSAWLPHWLSWLLTWLLNLLSFAVICILSLNLVFIVSSPFNSLLAEKLVYHITGHYPASHRDSWLATCQALPRCIKREWKKICYFFPRLLLVLLSAFIPVIQLTCPFTGFLLSSWATALNYLDYSYDNDKHSFMKLREDARANKSQVFSFGACVFLLSLIPFVNLFLIPCAISSGTLLALSLQKNTKSP